MFRPAFECCKHPKAGRNTQLISTNYLRILNSLIKTNPKLTNDAIRQEIHHVLFQALDLWPYDYKMVELFCG